MEENASKFIPWQKTLKYNTTKNFRAGVFFKILGSALPISEMRKVNTEKRYTSTNADSKGKKREQDPHLTSSFCTSFTIYISHTISCFLTSPNVLRSAKKKNSKILHKGKKQALPWWSSD